MIYANLIYFIIVIFIFSTNTPADVLELSPLAALAYGAVMLFVYALVAARLYRRCPPGSTGHYFSIEKKLTGLAVIVFGFFVYGLELKAYMQPLNFGGKTPVFENIGGLAVFFLILSISWMQARRSYEAIFNHPYSMVSFVVTNIRINLPIVLPWLGIGIVFDLLAMLPFSGGEELLLTPWGDLLIFIVFLILLAVFFPPMVRYIWGCKPMEEGPLRTRIEEFCKRQGFSSEILYWPLFEGQVLTAGVMGIIPKFRYLLLTPALIYCLEKKELESVLAHEIGHVKKKHILLYVLLFTGFSVVIGVMAGAAPYLILASDFFYQFLALFNMAPDTMLAGMMGLGMLTLMLVYFRFILGYFIRNSERQADLFVFAAQGTAVPIIRAFEKIAFLSGNIRDEKSWHHFGIGERIDFLEKCEQDRHLIRRHDRKLILSFIAYFLIVAGIVTGIQRLDVEEMAAGYEVRYAEAVLLAKVKREPYNSLWLHALGDLMQKKAMEKRAIDAYLRALEIDPVNATVNNNLAWLLLTAQDKTLRDSVLALTLARRAVLVSEEGFVLDTLATALWANGFGEEAMLMALKAIRADPANTKFYRSQIKRFATEQWASEDR
jgi:Zn-dependent protease with chaperone function